MKKPCLAFQLTALAVMALTLLSHASAQQAPPASVAHVLAQYSEAELAAMKKSCAEAPMPARGAAALSRLSAEQLEDARAFLCPGPSQEGIQGASGPLGLSGEEVNAGRDILKSRETPGKEADAAQPAKPAAAGGAAKSLFNRFRTTASYQDIDTELTPFGYDFFATTSLAELRPRSDMSAAPEYLIGPGDEVAVSFWGRVNGNYSAVVDRDGNINIPQMGPLHVAGMRFDQMKSYLSDRAEQIIGAKINVTLGSLKTIQVFVLGDVKRPGSYALGSFSTITTALLAAGGPSDIGSLRSVELRRANQVVEEMDFYRFLLKGDKSRDRVLQSGDVVFVHPVGPLVGVAGNVKRPAIYELKGEASLSEVLQLAGGIIPSAYTQQIQVERIQKNERQVVIDLNDGTLEQSRGFPLENGDLVKIFPIVDKDLNAVYLEGNVKRPGKYELKPGMRLRDVIKSPDDLLKDTHLEYALIKRLSPPNLRTELVPFNLGKLLLGGDEAENLELMPRDTVHVFSKWLFSDRPKVTVEGEVRKSGSIDLEDNMMVKDAVLAAGGLTRDAYLEDAEIYRVDRESMALSMERFNLRKALEGDPVHNLALRDRDRIVVHSMWEYLYKRTVRVEGEVRNPGVYTYANGMKVSDLVFAAGNVLESAYLGEAEISSHVLEDGKLAVVKREAVNLRKALEGDPAHDVELSPYDLLFVRQLEDWGEKKFVTISGEVPFPGKYMIKKGERLSSLIRRAGGYTEMAYLRGAVFTRESVKAIQQKQLNEMVRRLEMELLSSGGEAIAASQSPDEAKVLEIETRQKKALLEKLRHLEAQGRMTIRLDSPERLEGSEFDVVLEDGDALRVPANPQSVQVIGSVFNQSSFLYRSDMDLNDYIAMSGGYTDNADKSNTYILKVDGTAARPEGGKFLGINWNSGSNRWEPTTPRVEPGDTIVVPEKIDKIAWLRETKDITQILYQIAVTAGVLIVAF